MSVETVKQEVLQLLSIEAACPQHPLHTHPEDCPTNSQGKVIQVTL